jgi:hypothetical protein
MISYLNLNSNANKVNNKKDNIMSKLINDPDLKMVESDWNMLYIMNRRWKSIKKDLDYAMKESSKHGHYSIDIHVKNSKTLSKDLNINRYDFSTRYIDTTGIIIDEDRVFFASLFMIILSIISYSGIYYSMPLVKLSEKILLSIPIMIICIICIFLIYNYFKEFDTRHNEYNIYIDSRCNSEIDVNKFFLEKIKEEYGFLKIDYEDDIDDKSFLIRISWD